MDQGRIETVDDRGRDVRRLELPPEHVGATLGPETARHKREPHTTSWSPVPSTSRRRLARPARKAEPAGPIQWTEPLGVGQSWGRHECAPPQSRRRNSDLQPLSAVAYCDRKCPES